MLAVKEKEIRTEAGEIVCADLISAEADGIREFIDLILNRYQCVKMTEEETRMLLSSLFSLGQLITNHAIHAAQLADIIF